MKMKNKRGPWTALEKQFIKGHKAKLTAEEIATKLRRSPEAVASFIEELEKPLKKPNKKEIEKSQIREGLRSSKSWEKLKDEFTKDELAYFEEEYIGLVAQFKEDVLATEEQQIRKAITFDILMRRNMTARKKLLADIERVDKWQAASSKDYAAKKAGLNEADRQAKEEFLLNLESQLAALRSAEQGKTREFYDLDTRHQKLMEALKATREQRVARATDGKTSFTGLLKELADEEKREVEGRQMDWARKAGVAEFGRLSKPHLYDDGNEDLPILTANTVENLDVATQQSEEDSTKEE